MANGLRLSFLDTHRTGKPNPSCKESTSGNYAVCYFFANYTEALIETCKPDPEGKENRDFW